MDLQIFDFSKSVRNHPENTPKPSPNHPQTIPNPSQNYDIVWFFGFFVGKGNTHDDNDDDATSDNFIKKKTKNRKKIEIVGRIWDGLGVIWGRFGGVFDATSDRFWKIENSRIHPGGRPSAWNDPGSAFGLQGTPGIAPTVQNKPVMSSFSPYFQG